MIDRSIAPPFNRVESIKVEQVRYLELSTGLPLYYVSSGGQEVIKLEFITKAGSVYDTKPGVSFFTNKMLPGGTSQHNASAIAKWFEFYGAQVETNPGLDYLGLTVYILRKYLGKILPLLNDMLSCPSFPKKELDLQKTLKHDSLKVDLEKNQLLASRIIRANIFGKKHRYSRSLQLEDIRKVARNDVMGYFNDYFINSPLLIASGLVRDEELSLINQHLTHIAPKTVPPVPFTGYVTKPSRVVINRPHSIQSSIRLGKKSLHKNHPDYINLLVVNEILGGYFGSRLMKNIREDKGFTYGIYSNILNLADASIQIIGTEVKKELPNKHWTKSSKKSNSCKHSWFHQMSWKR